MWSMHHRKFSYRPGTMTKLLSPYHCSITLLLLLFCPFWGIYSEWQIQFLFLLHHSVKSHPIKFIKFINTNTSSSGFIAGRAEEGKGETRVIILGADFPNDIIISLRINPFELGALFSLDSWKTRYCFELKLSLVRHRIIVLLMGKHHPPIIYKWWPTTVELNNNKKESEQ